MAAPPPQQQQQRPQQPAMTPEQQRQMKLRFQVIFPQYIDSTLTKEHGRRLTGKQGVPHPTIEEMFRACHVMGFKIGTEVLVDPVRSLPCAQSQPFCIPPLRGCIRIAIKEPEAAVADGAERKSTRSDAPTKMEVMRKMAEIIKAIPDRKTSAETSAQTNARMSAEAMSEYMSKAGRAKAKGPKRQKVVVRR